NHFDDDLTISTDNPAKLIFSTSGNEANSNLSGTLPLPPVVTPPYAVCGNPNVPFTASFDRSTGLLTLNGSLPGNSIFDFGAQNLGSPLGVRRILVRIVDLALSTTGTGTIDSDGTLRVRQPGNSPFTFNGPPSMRIKDPAAGD